MAVMISLWGWVDAMVWITAAVHTGSEHGAVDWGQLLVGEVMLTLAVVCAPVRCEAPAHE